MKKFYLFIIAISATILPLAAQEVDSIWLDFLNASDSMYTDGLDTIYVVDNEGASGGG